MERLTTDDEKSMFYCFNLFYAKDNEIWVRGGGPEPDYQDVSLVQWIKRAATEHQLNVDAENAESLGDEMYDALQDGSDTVEGIVALLHAAAVQATEMRHRLKSVEDILDDDYDLDRLRELMEADREGRCVVQEYKPGDPVWVVERDEIEAPDCVSGYVFVAHANGAALVSAYLGDCGDVDAILADCIEETRETGECDIEVFPIEDCYHSIEDAESALKGEQNGD